MLSGKLYYYNLDTLQQGVTEKVVYNN